jgi:transcriptional regulator with PAS, ATPase and Fis domain
MIITLVTDFGSAQGLGSLARQIDALAASDPAPVLLLGERGTGKAWVARAIHHRSKRAGSPFVEVGGGGGGPAELGQDKGLGGVFDLANRGTIFLDAIDEWPLELQAQLLDLLGGDATGARERGEARMITATNRDLVREVEAGRFREDLYYRLNVTPLTLPPLRERSREDRLDLIMRILADLKPQLPGCPTECGTEVLDRLLAAPWPGNVRELRNVLERSVMLARGQHAVSVDHLPNDLRLRANTDRRYQAQSLSEVERQHIERTLRHHGGNRTRAALELGISRATLINKIKAYSLNI